MSIQWIARVLDYEHPDLDSGMKFVLLGLANHTNQPNQCFPSVRLLTKYTGQCERAVRSNIRKLEDAGLITVERREYKTSLYYLALGADDAPGGVQNLQGGGADDAGGGAESAPEPLLNRKVTDASDARAFDDDWQPSNETARKIAQMDGLSLAEIERERRVFVLKAQAGTVPSKPDAAFRAWCARVKDLNHKPTAPPTPAPAAGPPIVWDRAAKLAQLKRTRTLYEKMGKVEEIGAMDREIAAMEAENDEPDTPKQ